MSKLWKKGRGKLGFMQPLMGRWTAKAESPIGPIRCTRVFEPMGAYIRLSARWEFGAGAAKTREQCLEASGSGARVYEEVALIGVGDGGKVCFWSFTSDGKRSHGTVSDVSDIHPEAIGFEAQMPGGFARMAYWPDDDSGFYWVVESKTKKGWNRFTQHHYRAV